MLILSKKNSQKILRTISRTHFVIILHPYLMHPQIFDLHELTYFKYSALKQQSFNYVIYLYDLIFIIRKGVYSLGST